MTSALIEYRIGSHMCRHGGQHLLFAVNQIAGVERGKFKPVAMRNRVRRAGFYAISAENAAVVINVVNLGVALRAANPVLCRILRRLNIDAIRRAIGRAQEAGHALFQTILIPLQHVDAAEALLKLCATQRSVAVRIIFNLRGLKHLHEGDAHALGNGGNVLKDSHIDKYILPGLWRRSRRA